MMASASKEKKTENPIPIAVFATSNAIMRSGWLELSRESARYLGYEYFNYSVGGSSSCYGAYCAEQEQETQFAVYDFLLNDQILIELGALTPKQALGQHIALIRSLVSRGNADRSVVLLLTLKSAFIKRSHDVLRVNIRSILSDMGIKFIDVTEELPIWLTERGEAVDQAYQDDRHFTPVYQALIGDALLKEIQAKPVGIRTRRNRRQLLKLPPSRYRNLQIDNRKFEQSIVGTSLKTETVIDIPEGGTVVVSGAKYLAAYLFWNHQNAGGLIVESVEQRRFLLRRGFKDIFLFDTCSSHIQIDGQVRIIAKNDRKIPFQKALGLPSSIYDTKGSLNSIAYFVGCDVCPEDLVDNMRFSSQGIKRFISWFLN